MIIFNQLFNLIDLALMFGFAIGGALIGYGVALIRGAVS